MLRAAFAWHIGPKPAWGRLLPRNRPASGDGTARQLTASRPTRVVEELHQVAATTTERRLLAQVDFRREMRPIAFVDPGAFIRIDLGWDRRFGLRIVFAMHTSIATSC